MFVRLRATVHIHTKYEHVFRLYTTLGPVTKMRMYTLNNYL